MVAITAQRPRFDVGRVVNRTFGVLRRNALVFGLLTLGVLGLPAVGLAWMRTQVHLLGLLEINALIYGQLLVFMMLSSVLQGAIVEGVSLDQQNEKPDLGRCLSAGLRCLLPLLGIGLLTGFGLLAGLIATVLFASIVPLFGVIFVPVYLVLAVIAALAWVVTVPAIVIERRRIFEAFARSAKLTNNRRWPIFALMAAYLVALVLANMAAIWLRTLTKADWPDLVRPLLDAAISLIAAAGVASIYLELRFIREGVRPEALASVFD
jgi:hypothetical protein